jgi:photosystem II stability/assembly factor-like uncharacterized protein
MKQVRWVVPGVALIAALAVTSSTGRGQQAPTAAPPAGPFDGLHFRPLGPASMSGRISDIAAYEANPAMFYVGTAHGGVWKTVNNGTTFEAQMQDRGLMSIGDVAVSQNNPDLVWVGTGESNNRQSTSWGDGVYKSTDGGKTYTFMGLRTSRYINRIVIDPRNNETVFVAATGNLWGPGGERGIYRTSDGGKTWTQVLKVDDDTGANDLVMDPENNQVLYASTYQRRRTACCMNGGGPGSGIWKSADGGETWTRLKGGIPDGPLGRIGLDVSRKRPNILYASIEGPVQPGAGRGGRGAGAAEEGPGTAPAGAQAGGGAGGGFGRGGGPLNPNDPTGLYRSDDAGTTWRKVNNANPRPMYFSQVRVDPNDPDIVYLGGVGLHQTLDGGKTIATDVAQPIHDDIHAIWIDPSNSRHVIIGNDGGLAYSYDQAKTWVFVPNLPVGLFYHVSYDMATPFNVCGGMQDNYDWCGPSAVRGSAGIANHHWTTIQGGDGFVVLQDPADNRVIYSESQDGNIVRVDRVTGETMGIRPQAAQGEPALRWHWDTPIIISPHDPKVVYTAAQKVFRSADRGLSWTAISGDLTRNANRDEIVTMGVKGSDITIAKNDGIVAWPTIVSIAESSRRAGLLYAGTDDGNLQVSRDAGKTWTALYEKLPAAPKGAFVSEVVPSRFDEGTVYVTIDDHRQSNFDAFVYVSRDFGQTWQSANGNLSGEVVKTLTEDLKNPDVLYIGTETGLFVTTDRAKTWMRVRANLPTVRIDEITLHPRDNAMLLATHGRSLWILDHLEPIQEYAAAQSTAADAKLFTPPPASMYRRPARDRNYEFWGDQTFFGENPPQAALISWVMKKPSTDVKLKITDASGHEVREISGTVLANSGKAGLQSACWDLRVQPVPAPAGAQGGFGGRQGAGGGGAAAGGGRGGQPTQSPFGAGCATGGGGFGGFGGFGGGANPGPYVLAGVYNVSLVVDGKTVDTKPLRVADDPEVVLTSVERKKLFDMAMELHELQKRGTDTANAVTPLNMKVTELAQQVGGNESIPADVKATFDQFSKDLAAMAAKFAQPAGGRGFGGGAGGGAAAGGGRGGAGTESVMTQLAQAKNGLMGSMWPTEQTTRAYAEAKTKVPKAIADADALMTKAQALSTELAKYNVALTVPPVPTTKPSLK